MAVSNGGGVEDFVAQEQIITFLVRFWFCKDGLEEDRDVPWRGMCNTCVAVGRSSGYGLMACFQ